MRWMLALLVAACASAEPLDPSTMDTATFDRELAARFQYGPPEPAPQEIADQGAGQIADATYLQPFAEMDRAYSPATRVQAQRLLAALQRDAGTLSHEQFVLRVAEIAALADNGHTSIGENAFKKNTPATTHLSVCRRPLHRLGGAGVRRSARRTHRYHRRPLHQRTPSRHAPLRRRHGRASPAHARRHA